MVRVKPTDLAAARRYKARLQKALGERLLSLRAFGSRARGLSREDSDLDLAVVVDRADWNTRLDIFRLAAEHMDEDLIPISPLVLDPERVERLRRRERRLMIDIDREGVDI